MKTVTPARKDSSMALSNTDKEYVQGWRIARGLAHDKDALAEIIESHRKANAGPAAAGSTGPMAAPAGGD